MRAHTASEREKSEWSVSLGWLGRTMRRQTGGKASWALTESVLPSSSADVCSKVSPHVSGRLRCRVACFGKGVGDTAEAMLQIFLQAQHSPSHTHKYIFRLEMGRRKR